MAIARIAFPAILAVALTMAQVSNVWAELVSTPFHAREPRTCPDHTAPATGPITVEAATTYVICEKEHVFSEGLYLVFGITVQVGKGRPYQESDQHFPDIDPDQLVYPIRGGLVLYQCSPVSQIMENAGKNCNISAQPNATGTCYRTTFSDWHCDMLDVGNITNVIRRDVPPPPQ